MKSPASLIALFMLMSHCCLAQNSAGPGVESVAGDVIKNLRAEAKQKIILQADKQIYQAGETIWFKAYLIDLLTRRIITKSKIIYVDLVDEKDSVISSLLLQGEKLKTSGAISLSVSLHEGYYWLRSYTKPMIPEGIGSMALQPF